MGKKVSKHDPTHAEVARTVSISPEPKANNFTQYVSGGEPCRNPDDKQTDQRNERFTYDNESDPTRLLSVHCDSTSGLQYSVLTKISSVQSKKRKEISQTLHTMKQKGLIQAIETLVSSSLCKNCSTEEVAIILSSITSNSNLHLENDQLAKFLLDLYAVYYWVSSNISYDMAAWRDLVEGKSHPDVSAEHVLKNRMTICNGYANVFMDIAKEMRFKAVIVNGHFRVSLCDQEQTPPSFFKPNNTNTHAWNAVS